MSLTTMTDFVFCMPPNIQVKILCSYFQLKRGLDAATALANNLSGLSPFHAPIFNRISNCTSHRPCMSFMTRHAHYGSQDTFRNHLSPPTNPFPSVADVASPGTARRRPSLQPGHRQHVPRTNPQRTQPCEMAGGGHRVFIHAPDHGPG